MANSSHSAAEVRPNDGLDSLNGVDLSIGIAAASFAAAGMDFEQARRQAIALFRGVPTTRASVAQEDEQRRVTISLEMLRREFQHRNHRRLRFFVRSLMGADFKPFWMRAISNPDHPCFTQHQAAAIRELRSGRRRASKTSATQKTAISERRMTIEPVRSHSGGDETGAGGNAAPLNDNHPNFPC